MFGFLNQQDYNRYVADLNYRQVQAAMAQATPLYGSLVNLANIQAPSPTVARIRKIGGRAFSEELGERIAAAKGRLL